MFRHCECDGLSRGEGLDNDFMLCDEKRGKGSDIICCPLM